MDLARMPVANAEPNQSLLREFHTSLQLAVERVKELQNANANAKAASSPPKSNCLMMGVKPGIGLQGWLTKQGGTVRTWKRRWFTLAAQCATYQETPKSTKLKGSIPFDKDTQANSMTPELLRTLSNVPNGFAFYIRSTRRTFFLVAETESQRTEWVTSIRRTLSVLYPSNLLIPQPPPSPPASPPIPGPEMKERELLMRVRGLERELQARNTENGALKEQLRLAVAVAKNENREHLDPLLRQSSVLEEKIRGLSVQNEVLREAVEAAHLELQNKAAPPARSNRAEQPPVVSGATSGASAEIARLKAELAKAKDTAAAHQNHSAFLAAKLKRMERERELTMQATRRSVASVKIEYYDLQRKLRLVELRSDFFEKACGLTGEERAALLKQAEEEEKNDALRKETEFLRRAYFNTLVIATKLMQPQIASNISVDEMFERVSSECPRPEDWADWLHEVSRSSSPSSSSPSSSPRQTFDSYS